MKKLLSILLCLALLAGLFAVSAAAEDPAAAQPLTAAADAQAFAVTMAAWLSGAGDDAALEDPLFLWDAAGWYAAWLYRTAGCDLLDPASVESFVRSLGGEPAPLPEGWEEYGVVRVLRTPDGSEYYDFEQHKTEIDAMLGVDTMVSLLEGEGNSLTSVLSCYYEDDLSAEWIYALAFEPADAESAFPYRLTGLRLMDSGPQMDEALSFGWDELLEANRLGKLLEQYPAVRISSPNADGEDDGLSGTWLFAQSGEPALVSYGTDYLGGEYRGCLFEYDEEAGRAVVGYIEHDKDAGSLDASVSDYLAGVVIVQLEKEEDDLIWLVCTFRGGYSERVAVDRGTLALRVIDYSDGDSLPSGVIRFDYMKPAPAYDFMQSWDGALRTVTAVWEDFEYDEEADEWETVTWTDTDLLPADWEYLPYSARWDLYTAYLNEGYTQPYAYPGDGVDYTLYLTTAKG